MIVLFCAPLLSTISDRVPFRLYETDTCRCHNAMNSECVSSAESKTSEEAVNIAGGIPLEDWQDVMTSVIRPIAVMISPEQAVLTAVTGMKVIP